MIIEPELADRDYLRVLRQIVNHAVQIGRGARRILRMNADGSEHRLVIVGETNARLEVGWTFPGPNYDHLSDTGGKRSCDYLVAVGRELLVIDMAMGIDEHGCAVISIVHPAESLQEIPREPAHHLPMRRPATYLVT